MPMCVGQLLYTVFNSSLAIVRFMMNRSGIKNLKLMLSLGFHFISCQLRNWQNAFIID